MTRSSSDTLRQVVQVPVGWPFDSLMCCCDNALHVLARSCARAVRSVAVGFSVDREIRRVSVL